MPLPKERSGPIVLEVGAKVELTQGTQSFEDCSRYLPDHAGKVRHARKPLTEDENSLLFEARTHLQGQSSSRRLSDRRNQEIKGSSYSDFPPPPSKPAETLQVQLVEDPLAPLSRVKTKPQDQCREKLSMPRGGRRPGAGRPRGSANKRTREIAASRGRAHTAGIHDPGNARARPVGDRAS